MSAAALAAWAWSRAWGLPFGPSSGVAESVDWLDGLTAAVEVVAVLVALRWLLTAPGRSGPTGEVGDRGARRRAPVPVACALALVAGAGVLVASPLGQHRHGGADHHAEGAAGHDAGAGHEHVEEAVIPDRPLSAEIRTELAAQLTRVRELALAHPTVADAEAAGYLRAGPFAPGAGAHYVNQDYGQAQTFDLEKPLSYLYAGTDPDSPIVGVMYFTLTDTPPEGFAGPLDTWHEHNGVCLQTRPDGSIDVPLPPDGDLTEADCARFDGEYLGITGQMVHAWVVPGWDSPSGVFSHDNPIVTCGDGRSDLGADLYLGCVGI